ncbi:glycosyltransferase (plasmid) [Phaeobacter inhibens]|uniref:Putative glycosyl transferase n=1 Tax=Phaeobacter porticola TaxID=1844006 RepID=A0A1L3IAX9_9RHOB|nr:MULTISPECIES: glycosyltransferase family 2 protein [Phaeobacter]AFO93619.1 putative glycosyl transferase [Phaeobacter inhibens DSM 17395]APG49349.1 putative glycosyl transferase [Phaeobacter porticola]AUQ48292.1 putative glycosyl transferase [Phaeobacter inhibens]AXT25116.1 glycosyltransferase [Phaeobacter inhibens]
MNIRSSLAAVIVTYNRLDKLKRVIAALQAQTCLPERVFVIDNASTDETGSWLTQLQQDDPRFQHVRLPENIGGAGGFYEGARVAYEEGYDYIWFSDDDAYPDPNAIELLLTGIKDFEARFTWRPSFACSAVKWTNGDLCEMNTPSTVWDWPRFYSPETPYFLVGSCSFVSVLVPRWAIQKHGFPIKEYFIWYDDAEYTQRIAKSYPGIYCPNSVVVHDVPENKGVNYSLVNQANIWKFRYGARNEASFRRREQGWAGVAVFARGVRRQMRQGNVEKSLRREVYKAIWRGCSFNPQIIRPDPDTGV